MNCAYHKDHEVEGVCSTCGRPICAECLVNLNGQIHCKACLAARMHKPRRDINGGLRFLLSVVPGLGHLYMGLFNRGLQLVGAFFLTILIIAITNVGILGLIFPVLVFFSIFDAREIHLRMMQGLEVPDSGFVDTNTWHFEWGSHSRYIGYGLVVIGIIALYRTVIDDILWLWFRSDLYYRAVGAVQGVVVGGLAIAGGLWMLGRNFKRS